MKESLETTSRNFRVAKPAAIVLVMLGHFATGIPGFWMLVTVGLFVFGFSSGYFTSLRYHEGFRWGPFWRRKAVRLLPHLLGADLFLLALFLTRGREGIWTWQTLLGVTGLKGFLTWLGLPNPSPYGAGVWFLTLLLLFYAAYPLLRLAVRRRAGAVALTAVGLAATLLLQWLAPMGHMLWLTAWAFVFGVAAERLALRTSAWWSGAAAAGLALVLGALNATGIGSEAVNFLLLVGLCVIATMWIKSAALLGTALAPLGALSGCLLEMYLLHAYLHVSTGGGRLADLAVSVALVVGVSWLLAAGIDQATKRLFSLRPQGSRAIAGGPAAAAGEAEAAS
jgi:peptidoglycan/LPS O-acetylase OafA/YrhL